MELRTRSSFAHASRFHLHERVRWEIAAKIGPSLEHIELQPQNLLAEVISTRLRGSQRSASALKSVSHATDATPKPVLYQTWSSSLTCRFALARPLGAEYSAVLCDLGVLVDQAAELVPAQNTPTGQFGSWTRTAGGFYCSARCGRCVLLRHEVARGE